MGVEQNVIQTIIHSAIEAAKAAVMAVKESENPVNAAILVHIMPTTGSPALKQPTFDLKATKKYQEA